MHNGGGNGNGTTSGPDPQGPGVLLVDDEEDILFTLQWFIRRHFPQVRLFSALSGEEALKIVSNEPLRLIVTDYRMSGMDGLEFLVRARALAPGVTRMLCTAYPDPGIQDRALKEAAVSHFFPKVFEMTPLLEAIRWVLSRPDEMQAPQRLL